jgi:hypothetical protein
VPTLGATEADRAQESILRQCGGAEDFRQTTVPDAPLELHLPQTVLRVYVAETEERVALGVRDDVRNGVRVADNVYGLVETVDGEGAVHDWKGLSQVPISAEAHERDESDQRTDGREEPALHWDQ